MMNTGEIMANRKRKRKLKKWVKAAVFMMVLFIISTAGWICYGLFINGMEDAVYSYVYEKPLIRVENSIKFDVTGKGILWTKLMQFEKHGKDLILNLVQIVTDHDKKDAGRESNLLKANSPVYNDGTTTLLREVEGVNYKVSNGQDTATITIENTNISDQVAENVCVGYGMYTDSTMNGKEILVQVSFSNVMLIPIKIIGIVQDAQGRIIGTRGISLQPGGTFRPGLIVLDSNLQERRVFGKPISLPQGMMFITVGLVDQGAQLGYLISAGGELTGNMLRLRFDLPQLWLIYLLLALTPLCLPPPDRLSRPPKLKGLKT